MKPLANEVKNERQKTIAKLQIKKGFPEMFWKYCTFTEENYVRMQKDEEEAVKKIYKEKGAVKSK
jgi:hypothetical protein